MNQNHDMKYTYLTILLAIALSVYSLWYSFQIKKSLEFTLGSAILSTASSDTLEKFRTNVNSSLTSLNNDRVSTTTAYTWTEIQKFFGSASTTVFSGNSAEFGGSATTSISSSGTLGIASSSPLGKLGIGTTGATSTISGGYFCAYFKDEQGRGLWLVLSTSTNTVFSTTTRACNN